MFDNSSDEELDMVIETDEISIMLPSLSELVKTVDNTQLLPAIRLCLAWLIDKQDVLGQTGLGSEQLWHNLARLFTLLALQEKVSMTASEAVSKVISEITVEMPLWEDWLLRGSSQKWTIRWTGRASWRRGTRGLPGWSGFARCGTGCVLIRIAR